VSVVLTPFVPPEPDEHPAASRMAAPAAASRTARCDSKVPPVRSAGRRSPTGSRQTVAGHPAGWGRKWGSQSRTPPDSDGRRAPETPVFAGLQGSGRPRLAGTGQPVAPSHGRGHWFDPSIAHPPRASRPTGRACRVTPRCKRRMRQGPTIRRRPRPPCPRPIRSRW